MIIPTRRSLMTECKPLDAAQRFICAVRHLKWKRRRVTHRGERLFCPILRFSDETFGFHEVIAQTGRFKVYRTSR